MRSTLSMRAVRHFPYFRSVVQLDFNELLLPNPVTGGGLHFTFLDAYEHAQEDMAMEV
jgi:hypothetical protein